VNIQIGLNWVSKNGPMSNFLPNTSWRWGGYERTISTDNLHITIRMMNTVAYSCEKLTKEAQEDIVYDILNDDIDDFMTLSDT